MRYFLPYPFILYAEYQAHLLVEVITILQNTTCSCSYVCYFMHAYVPTCCLCVLFFLIASHFKDNNVNICDSCFFPATFFGLGRLLTNCETFEEIKELCTQGDRNNVDLLVQDIYGTKQPISLGLPPVMNDNIHYFATLFIVLTQFISSIIQTLVAASFGKAVRQKLSQEIATSVESKPGPSKMADSTSSTSSTSSTTSSYPTSSTSITTTTPTEGSKPTSSAPIDIRSQFRLVPTHLTIAWCNNDTHCKHFV